MKFISQSEKDTYDLAKKMAKTLRGGEIIGLVGELGAGKTVFTKGLAAGLGIKKHITSPTFILMKIYRITNRKLQIAKFIHIDAYRLKNFHDLKNIGIEEYLNRKDAIVIIEWADIVKRGLPKRAKFIKIISIKNKREIYV